MEEYEILKQAIRNAKHGVVFTGAGVSTLSGIPDFRGKNGLYGRSEIDANKLFDIHYFMQDPKYFYKHAREMVYGTQEIQPNLIHQTLARWESLGVVRSVVTQNIDRLHQRAGSHRVIELHGSAEHHHCLTCEKSYEFEDVQRMLQHKAVPYCSCGGVIKPDITFFGEMLPEQAWREAEKEVERADLMLVLGSSLVVQPAASIPARMIQQRKSVVIINEGETPFDAWATLRYSSLDEVFCTLQNML